MKFLFLNQYFPPDPAPTGLLMGEIAERLVASGHHVELVGVEDDYRESKKGGGRMRREAGSLWKLLRAGMAARRPDLVFAGSSPPCLVIVAGLVAWWHRARLAHWAMDLYPELAVALGEIGEGFVSSAAKALTWRACRRAVLLVAVDEDMKMRLAGALPETESISPWVTREVLKGIEQATPDFRADPGVWLYSGNLGRAHEWETLLEAQALLERRGVAATLRFQGGGAARPMGMERAERLGLRRCEWRDYASPDRLVETLTSASVAVATQREEVHSLLWPSKLALLMGLSTPILWVGPVTGAVAANLRKDPGAGVFAPGDAEGVADFVEAAITGRIPRRVPLDARAQRESALERFRLLLERAAIPAGPDQKTGSAHPIRPSR